MRLLRGAAVVLAVGLFALAGVIRLEHLPPPWWDEGWTLNVARNWVVLGHYGHLQLGLPSNAALAAHFPVVALVAGGFAIFGVGLFQARIVILVCTLVMLVLLWLLARDLFNRKIAMVTLVLACCFPIQWEFVPMLFGRQVLGEVPALAFLLAGFVLLARSGGRRPVLLTLSALAFGIAFQTKAQVQPFLLVGLVLPLGLVFTRHRRTVLPLAAVAAGTLGAVWVLALVREAVLSGHTVAGGQIVGLTEASAIVLSPAIRLSMLRFSVGAGLPITVSLGVFVWQMIREVREEPSISWTAVVRSVLLLVAAGWYAWFVVLSIGWGRYVYPPWVLAVPFLAALMIRLSAIGLSRLHGTPSSGPRWGARRVGSLLLLGVIGMLLLRQAGLGVVGLHTLDSGDEFKEVVTYLNTRTPVHSTVETYESEILFLLDRPYTTPPPQMDVSLIEMATGDSSSTYRYAPDVLSTDYLVVGPFGREVYDRLLRSGTLERVATFGTYEVFRGRRSAK